MQLLLMLISSNWTLGANGISVAEPLMLLAAIGVIVLIWRSRFKIVEASCAACEYPVRGLTTDRCPECGGLFSEVGITPAGTRRGISTLGRCVLWTIAFAIIGTQITNSVEKFAPATFTNDATVILSSPDSKAYNRVRIDFYEHIDLADKSEQKFKIQLFVTSDTSSAIAYVDLIEQSIRFEESIDSSTKIDLNIESLLDWMQPSLQNTKRETIRNEATDIFNTFFGLASSNGQSRGLSNGNSYSSLSLSISSSSSSPYKDFAILVLYLIWFVVVIILIRQRPNNVYKNDNSSGVRRLY